MKKLSANAIRNLWLDFFKKSNHLELPSASLIPQDDKSLLWINSGVATLKAYFDGRLTPPAKRLVNSQKAIRTNDIENVGVTSRHHTFFEMLGNFSIGDYFKKTAIAYAWEFLTSDEYLAIDPQLLFITVFKDDHDTFNEWVAQGIDPQHLILGNRSTNFWDLGQGPCGPNSEIFFDRGIKYDPENIGLRLLKEDLENDRYIEIWNIVFSQYNNDGYRNYSDLPTKNIDTGAGLERITALSQNVPTNFDTDLFLPLIQEIEKYSHHKYDVNNYFTNDQFQRKINNAFRIIADHIRTATFAIADGAVPGNSGRDYIIRRLVRRALRYSRVLGVIEIFLYRIANVVIKIMSDYYPYLKTHQKLIIANIKLEEERFHKTLDTGQHLLATMIAHLQKNHKTTLNGDDAFKLYDTYGFPIELTREIANEANLLVDEVGFKKADEHHRNLARQSRRKITSMNVQSNFFSNLNISSEFMGYHHLSQLDATPVIIFEDEVILKNISNEGFVIFDKTPFYAESGGQVADSGYITNKANDFYATIIDVQKGPHGWHIHHIKVVKGQLKTGAKYQLYVNQLKRSLTMNNHSATHLLFAALTQVLGHSSVQAGSFLNDQYLRFDFASNPKPSREVINKAQALANKWIKAKAAVKIIHTTIDKALAMGAISLEKSEYSENVRVVELNKYSLELCGGTHVANISDIEEIQVINYDTKQSGVYRIEAITTHRHIKEYFHNKISHIFNTLRDINIEYQALLKSRKIKDAALNKLANLADVPNTYSGLLEISHKLNEYQSHLKKYKKRLLSAKTNDLLSNFNYLESDLKLLDPISETTYYHYHFKDITDPKVMQTIGKAMIIKYPNTVAFFTTHNKKRQNIWAIFSGELAIKNHHLANGYAKIIATFLQGRGGGKPHMAMVSGANTPFIEVLHHIRKVGA